MSARVATAEMCHLSVMESVFIVTSDKKCLSLLRIEGNI